jgi:hypothetical protein
LISRQQEEADVFPMFVQSKMTMENVGKSFKFSKQTMKALDAFTIPSSIAKDVSKPIISPTTLSHSVN